MLSQGPASSFPQHVVFSCVAEHLMFDPLSFYLACELVMLAGKAAIPT